MKSFRRLISVVLVLMLIMSTMSVTLQAYALSSGQDVGFGTVSSVTTEREVGTNSGIVYDEFKVTGNSGGAQQMYSLTFNPKTSNYVPMAFSKNAGYGAVTLDSAKQAETLGYDVKGGVNASFFDFTGTSCNTYGGITISEGKVMHGVSAPSTGATWVMTFDSAGNANLVKSLVRFAVSVNNGAWTASIENINACPDSSSATTTGIYYYDSFSGSTTHTKTTGVEIVFEKLDNTELIVGGTLRGRVVAIRNSTAVNGSVGANQFILYASNSSEYAASLRALAVGDTVEVTANENMPEARAAMESCITAFPTYGYDLVLNGVDVTSSNPLGESFSTQRAQRSGIGVKADGTVILVATQGRGTTYAGLTLYELADYFISQGCVTAVNLDGGGSTQMTVENTSGTLTAPISFGRRVSNSILVVERQTISDEERNTLADLISQASAVENKTAYLNDALVNAKKVYATETSMSGDYTRAIMELQDGISENGNTNLVSGMDYTTTGTISENYITDLTDGSATDGGDISLWNGWTSDGTVEFDLGKIYSIDKIRVHLMDRASYAIYSPGVSVAFSNDGVNYTTHSAQFPLMSVDATYWTQADNLNVNARYVRVSFALNSGFAFVNEIEVLGKDYDVNIALGKNYTVDADVGEEYNYTTDLTDGVAENSSSIHNNRWMGLHSDGSVTFDLGDTYKITKARIHMLNIASYGIYPANVSISVSNDGKNFTEYDGIFITQTEDGVYWCELDNIAVGGRYVRISFARTGSWAFLNEIELYGKRNLALDADYVIETDGGHNGLSEKYHENGERLTDGSKLVGDVNNDNYVNDISTINSGYTRWVDASYVDIIVDLGGVVPTGTYTLYSVSDFYGYTPIEGVKVSVSTDGVNFTDVYGQICTQEVVGYAEQYDGTTPGMYKYTVSTAGLVDARYVKFTVTPCEMEGYAGVDEVEVTAGLAENLEQTYENLLSGLTHLSTTGSEVGALTYKSDLTDGVAHPYNQGEWFGIRSSSLDATNANTVNDSADFIYDLGEIYDISGARIHLMNTTGSGICTPKSLKLWVSADGVTYTNCATFTTDSTNGTCYWATVDNAEGLVGRYVKITVDMNADKSNGGGGWVFLNEIEVYGEKTELPSGEILGVTYVVDGENVVFTVTTSPDYNRIKVTTADALSGYIKYASDCTVDAQGNTVYTLTVPAIVGTTKYAFDGRLTATGIYEYDYYYVDVTVEAPAEDEELFKSVSYEIKDDKIIFTVVTAAGDYNRIKVTTADALSSSLGVGTTYTVDTNGNYVWTFKVAAPTESTTYAFDLRSAATNKYLKEYYTFDVEYVDTSIFKSVSYEVENGKIIFTVVTLAGEYNRIKVTTADALSSSLAVSNTYTVDENGNYVWVVKTDAPTKTTSYAFDLRTTANKYLKDYYIAEVEYVDEVIFKSTSYEIKDGKVIFTAVTKAGDYNRVKIALLDNITSYVKYIDTYTVNADGDYVWTLKFNAPDAATEYALDIRIASTMKYVKDYYYVTVDPTTAEPETVFVSGSGVIADGKLTLTIVTLPTTVNRVKVMLTSDQSTYVKLIDKYTVDVNGNYVWTATVAAPSETTSYTCDVRSSETGRYMKDYFTFEVAVEEKTEIYKSVSYEIVDGKIVFTVVTSAGNYDRIKVANADTPKTSLGVGTYTVAENGDYVWTVKVTAPTESTSYAFDLRITDEYKYLKDYYIYDVAI